jgi:hypothetical protein
MTSFFCWAILKFNLGILLFTMGTVAFIILVSKAFSKAGYATQIGSLLYLVPLFLSLYLRALDMKHKMAESANKGLQGELDPDQDQWSGARRYFKDHPQNTSDSAAVPSPFGDDFKVIEDDQPYAWEAMAHKAIQLMPHTSFTDAAVYSFSSKSITDVYFLQLLSFLALMSLILAAENAGWIKARIASWISGKKGPESKAVQY